MERIGRMGRGSCQVKEERASFGRAAAVRERAMAGFVFRADQFRALARERRLPLGAPLVVSESTGSTNDDAMSAARGGALHGATFVAEAQTAGRGRRGQVWRSPPGENLTFSVVLRLDCAPERVAALALVAGLAVREVAEARVPARVKLKWPNDLLACDRKLAGILVESQIACGRIGAVVVGVGLNVASRELPEEIRAIATSLALLGATRLEREELLVDLLGELDRKIGAYVQDGLGAWLDELRAHDALRGRRIEIDGRIGVARGIADDGSLLIEDDTGRVRRVLSGTVRLAQAASAAGA
jgi:BirA family transcriptional regulator, biotin operon repressor / biotin---[acetyl-CoA-carboxylase] ligase